MKKKKLKIPIFGIAFLFFAISFLAIELSGYVRQLGQRDWSVATATAVSYTHLDVYKRQLPYRSIVESPLILTFCVLSLHGAIAPDR